MIKSKRYVLLLLLTIIFIIIIIIVFNFTHHREENIEVEHLHKLDAEVPYLPFFISHSKISSIQKIPKVVCATCEDRKKISGFYRKMWWNTVERNPEYDFYFYDKYDRERFILNYFGEKILNTYNKLIPGAYKADLFRYCYIYIKGGVYLDINKQILFPFREIIDPLADLIVVKEREMKKDYLHGIYQAFLCAVPRLEFMFDVVYKCVDNINNKYYGNTSLDPTGPVMLGLMFVKYFNLSKIDVGIYDLNGLNIHIWYLTQDGNSVYKNKNSKKVINTMVNNILRSIERTNKHTYYNELWKRHRIYK